jgi:UDP-N-acetylmuramoyl-L-alanyl-D-glutamate--2,6-diaminopimelate ligase
MGEGRRPRKRLGELLVRIDHKVTGSPQVEIAGLSYDSRRVGAGELFICLVGAKADGHSFIPEAARRGAAALLVNSGRENAAAGFDLPVAAVPDTRRAMAQVASSFYDNPSRRLSLIGITGTNGKTTTSYLTAAILRAAGRKTGIIGTLAYRIGEETRPAPHTTPEAPDLQALLFEMAEAGVTEVAMEVSSHALALHRVDGCRFRFAVFTNLSRDHLDFHASLDDYLATKERLFAAPEFQPEQGERVNILNADDPASRRLAEVGLGRHLTYGLGKDADVAAEDIVAAASGTRFKVRAPQGSAGLALRLVGGFNVANALAALATGLAAGVDLETAVAGLEGADTVRGRFQRLPSASRTVIVDYAHTPDGLEKVLAAARGLTRGELRLVFGCGGDRDPGKRPQMGEVASRLADRCYLTSDNPRSEDPQEIIAQIAGGIPEAQRGKCVIEPDREAAIRRAIVEASAEDVVLLAGKGHETYQIFADRTIHFDDREVAEKVLSELEPD